jgi:hypothetical protein
MPGAPNFDAKQTAEFKEVIIKNIFNLRNIIF